MDATSPETADAVPSPPSAPAAPAVPVPLEFELQRAQGDAIEGPYDRITLQEMLYTGRLTGSERVRVPGSGEFETVAERAELAAIRARFHGETVRGRGSLNAAPEAQAAPAPIRADAAVTEAMQKAGVEPGRLAILVVGTLLVGVAVVVGLYVSLL